MQNYYYLAFVPCEGAYAIFSPDFREITSQGETLAECMAMGEDALAIAAEEYAQRRRPMPEPCDLGEARRRMEAFFREMDIKPAGEVLYQLVGAPDTDMTPVKISATFTRYALDVIDRKAKARGMTRSGFLADLALRA